MNSPPQKIKSNSYYLGLNARKPVFRGFANNTGADQPAHPRSLISSFVIPFLERTIFNLAKWKISIFLLVSVTETRFDGNPEDGFSRDEAHLLKEFHRHMDEGTVFHKHIF